MVDLLQIEQVMLNLLRNAAQAISETGRPGIVTVAASLVNLEQVQIEVRDTGLGFSAEFAGANFPPLSSSKVEGLGVGLSLCRSIVESHAGRLMIGGGADGAVVRITLPVAKVG